MSIARPSEIVNSELNYSMREVQKDVRVRNDR